MSSCGPNLWFDKKYLIIDFDYYLVISPRGLPGRSGNLTRWSGNSEEVEAKPMILLVVFFISSEADLKKISGV